jgi:hypothetical protein
VPPPSRGSQRTLPPWRSAICLTSDRPRPTPPACSAWPGRRKERLEDPLAHLRRHAGAAIADLDRGVAGRSPPPAQQDRDRAAAVAARVLEQVAQGAAQQPLVAVDHRLAFGIDRRIDPRRLLGGDGEQVDPVAMQRILGTVEPAGEQHLLDQRVELGDVAVDLGLELVALRRRGAVEHRHRHLHPRQRRAQLVAGVGEQRPVRLHQGLDPLRRDVEARGDGGDLVVAADLDPMAELAGAELLHALLERLEPAGQPPHHRIGAGGDGDEQHHQDDRQAGPARKVSRQRRPRRRRLRRPVGPAATALFPICRSCPGGRSRACVRRRT